MMDTASKNVTGAAAARAPKKVESVLVSGASGLVGQALLAALAGRGLSTSKLVRKPASKGEVFWDPTSRELDESALSADAVVHLAGENIAGGRWTKAKMAAIRDSRVQGTKLLCESLARMKAPPSVLVCASAIGFYGEGGDSVLTEDSPSGDSFLAEVCKEWEQATEAAEQAGIRVVHIRIGVVLDADGGALQKMLLPFKLGLGGKIGDGQQYMSWVLLQDLVSIIGAAIDNPKLSGAVNATAPQPVTNLEFTKTLGRVLGRPTIAPMPAFAAKLAFGRMAEELLLASLRVTPNKLLEHEFPFREPKLEGALRAALKRGQ